MTALASDPLIVGTALGVLVLTIFRALWHKLASHAEFRGVLAGYGIVPEALVPMTAIALAAAEIATIAGLLLPATRAYGAGLAAALLAAYAGAMAVNLLRGRHSIDCGCGGAGQPVSWPLVARNLALIGVAGLAGLAPAPRPLTLVDHVAVPAAIGTVWLLLVGLEQLSRNAAHIRAARARGRI